MLAQFRFVRPVDCAFEKGRGTDATASECSAASEVCGLPSARARSWLKLNSSHLKEEGRKDQVGAWLMMRCGGGGTGMNYEKPHQLPLYVQGGPTGFNTRNVEINC